MFDEVVKPLLFATLVWWSSTAIVLWLIGRPQRVFPAIAIGATVVAAIATAALISLRNEVGALGAYAGFAAGVALWAWHEVMFLLGFINGPRRSPCPPGLSFWGRFRASTETVIHHEAAIAAHGLLILGLSWGAQNQVAAWTYLLLWGMRISAKLVVFTGAPNLSDHFLPDHLSYLKSYFSKRSAPSCFLVAITATLVVSVFLIQQAIAAPSGTMEAVAFVLLSGLAALAVFEHAALAMPLPDAALFNWAARPASDRPILRQDPSPAGGPFISVDPTIDRLNRPKRTGRVSPEGRTP